MFMDDEGVKQQQQQYTGGDDHYGWVVRNATLFLGDIQNMKSGIV